VAPPCQWHIPTSDKDTSNRLWKLYEWYLPKVTPHPPVVACTTLTTHQTDITISVTRLYQWHLSASDALCRPHANEPTTFLLPSLWIRRWVVELMGMMTL